MSNPSRVATLMPQERLFRRRIAQNLNTVMKDRQITNEEMHVATGLSAAVISNLRTGKGNPQLRTLALIAHALNITIDDLIANMR